jgi:hydrogenase expression/formation protein HypC
MCLGIPGRVEEVRDDASGVRMGTVSFGGIRKDVCLACVPGIAPGDYVIVHVGFAISRIDEAEARRVFELLETIGELEGLDPAADTPPRSAEDGARRVTASEA